MRAAPSAQPATPDDIDLRDVFRTIGRKLPKLLLGSLAIGALTVGVLSTMLPRYTSLAQLEVLSTGIIDPTKPTEPGQPRDVTARMDQAAIGTHAAAMQSNEIALKLVEEFRLTERPEFNAALPPSDTFSRVLRMAGIGSAKAEEADRDRALTALRQNLRVFNARETRQISVQMTAADPQLAARIANRVGELYRERLTTATIVETEDASVKLKPQVERLTREVAIAEQDVVEFRGKVDSFKGNQPTGGLSEQQLSELTAEQVKAQTAKSEAEGRAAAAREMMARGTAEALPDVQKSLLIPRLVEQRVRLERQISELSATLLPAHPRMKQMQADLSGLNRQLRAEVQKVVDSIDRDAKLAAEREAAVRQRIATVKQVVTQKGPDEARLRSLEENVKIKRDELARVQKQFETATSTVGTRAVPVEVRFVSQALPSSEKAFPKISLIAPLTMASSFILGLFLVGIKALFQGARSGGTHMNAPTYAQDQSRPNLDAHPQGSPTRALAAETIPVMQPMAVARNTSAVSTIGGVAQKLLTRADGKTGCRALVTGAQASFDAAPEALALAQALSAAGKSVVLIEWADRGGSLSSTLGIVSQAGVTELIAGTATFDDCMQSVDGSEIHVITAGLATLASADIDADRANLILDALDEAYAHIIVVAAEPRAKGLFTAIEGRFDIGITVDDNKRRGAIVSDQPDAFLGYAVQGLEVFAVQRVDLSGRRQPGSPQGGSGPTTRSQRQTNRAEPALT